jgi:hypothetical protein
VVCLLASLLGSIKYANTAAGARANPVSITTPIIGT